MTEKPYTIAIDGLAATGKGTLARRLAAHFGLAYLDTGLLYRAVGVAVLRAGGDPADPQAAEKAALSLDSEAIGAMGSDEALRTPAASDAASKVAVVPAVRAALLQFQRDFAARPPEGKAGAVLDGRDIGTVVVPHAMVKIYVEASPEVRAKRRTLELLSRGENVTETQVLAEMQARDARDAGRSAAPTKPADDAVILDTTSLNADQAFEAAAKIVKEKINGRRENTSYCDLG